MAQSESDGTPEPERTRYALGEEAYSATLCRLSWRRWDGCGRKAETIVGMELEPVAFVELLRAGGGYGNEHIFGPTKISDDGIVSLLAYVQTLSE